jgi:hypothetical protein
VSPGVLHGLDVTVHIEAMLVTGVFKSRSIECHG